MKFEIKNRWTGEVKFTAEIDCDENTPLGIKIGLAVKWAIKRGSDLRGSDLRGSDLSGSDLSDCDLRGINLRGSNLRGSDLSVSDLRGSDLSDCDLSDCDLSGSDLSDCDLSDCVGISDDAPLPEGITLGEFREKIVPQLLTAGDKTVAECVAAGCWDCHDWSNCPMHFALGIGGESEAPIMLRPWVKRFVQLFDAGLIPEPEVK